MGIAASELFIVCVRTLELAGDSNRASARAFAADRASERKYVHAQSKFHGKMSAQNVFFFFISRKTKSLESSN